MSTIRALAVVLAVGGIAAWVNPCNREALSGFAYSCASPLQAEELSLAPTNDASQGDILSKGVKAPAPFTHAHHRKLGDTAPPPSGRIAEAKQYYTRYEMPLESLYAIAASTADDACCSGGASGGTDATGNECISTDELTVVAESD